MPFGNYGRKSMLVTLILSFVLVLFIPLVSEGFLYRKMASVMEQNANRSNLAMLNQIENVIDNQLHEAHQLAYEIAFNPKLRLLLRYDHPPTLENNYDYISFMDDLKNYHVFNNAIDHYYLYFPQQNVVLTPNVKSDSRTFYHYLYPHAKKGYSDWRNTITQVSGGESFLPSGKPGSGFDLLGKKFTYIQPLPFGSRNPEGYLVEVLNGKQITEMLKSMEWANRGNIFILDQNNHPIIATANGLNLPAHFFQNLTGNIGLEQRNINGKDMMVSHVLSRNSGWKVVSVVSKSVFLHEAHVIRTTVLLSLAICLIIGLALSGWFAYRQYRPVRDMVRAIINKKQRRSCSGNELQLISETLTEGWNEEEQLRQAIENRMPEVQANFLSRLLRGFVEPSALSNESLALMDIQFASDDFAAAVIDIDDCAQFSKEDAERRWAAARFVISNVAKELIDRHHQEFAVELDRGRLALIINFQAHPKVNFGKEIKAVLHELKRALELNFHIYISVGVGNPCTGPSHISRSFREALQALEYRMVKGENKITFYSEMSETEAYYFYPVDIEQQFMNVVKTGDFEAADRILDDVFVANFKARRISLELGQCLFFNIMSTFVKILNDLNLDFKQVFSEKPEPVKVLARCASLEEMHKKVKEYYQTLCRYIAVNQSDHATRLLKGIVGYLDEHYNDGLLSLSSVAEEFDITPQYLSSFFKKHKGETIKAYLGKVRLEHAKQLLKNDGLTLSQIAEKVGYANDVGLIRLFKKHEGITPGKFRVHLDEMGSTEA